MEFFSDFKGHLINFYLLKALENEEFCKFKLTKSDFYFYFIKFPDFSWLFFKTPHFFLTFVIFLNFPWLPDRVATLPFSFLFIVKSRIPSENLKLPANMLMNFYFFAHHFKLQNIESFKVLSGTSSLYFKTPKNTPKTFFLFTSLPNDFKRILFFKFKFHFF